VFHLGADDLGGVQHIAPLALNYFMKKADYVRNVPEGSPFTLIGLKDVGKAGTSIREVSSGQSS
jgi:hypothetical protein